MNLRVLKRENTQPWKLELGEESGKGSGKGSGEGSGKESEKRNGKGSEKRKGKGYSWEGIW